MQTRKWQTVKNQVILGFSLLILLIIGTAILTVNEYTTLSKIVSAIHEHPLEVSSNALRARVGVAIIQSNMKEIYLSDDASTINDSIDTMQYEENRIYQSLDIVRSRIIGDGGKELEKKSRSLIDEWKPIRERVLSIRSAGTRGVELRQIMEEEASLVIDIENTLLELSAYARNKASIFLQRSEKIQKRARSMMILFTITGVFLSLIIALITIRRFNYSMKRYREAEEEQERLILELQKALSEVKTLSGFLPICASCKKIRDDRGYWNQIESYIRTHSDVEFSHSLCPECAQKLYPKLTKNSTK